MYGQRLRELRYEKKLSQRALAEILGVTQKDISRYELEQIEPNIGMIVKICDYFEVTADFLLGRTDY